jgi:hypothetical protein
MNSFITFSLIGDDYVGTPGNLTNNNIESGQAFLVQSTGPGSLVFNETSKGSGFNNTVFRGQKTGGLVQLLRTNLYNLNTDGSTYLSDGTLIQFGDEYSDTVDGMDARKFFNSGINLTIKKDNKSLAIERRPLPDKQDTIFMNLTGAGAQNYKFEFIAKGLAPTGLEGYLEDHYLQTLTPLNMEDTTIYNFKIENVQGSKAADRFDIIFKPGIVLPASITSIDAYTKDRDIVVDWKVIHEKNVQQYEVERSYDGVQFIKVATVAAANTGAGDYSWIDPKVLPGYYYYRIRSIDNQGKVQYTKNVKILIGNGNPMISIYPNPITNGIINLQFINQPAGNYGIRLMNQLGQIIVSKQVERMEGSNSESIKWDYNLSHGVYQLEIIQPNGQVKVIKVMY